MSTSHLTSLPQYDCLRIDSFREHRYGPSELEDSRTHRLICNHFLSSEWINLEPARELPLG